MEKNTATLSLAKCLTSGLVFLCVVLFSLPKIAVGQDAEPPASGTSYVTNPINGKLGTQTSLSVTALAVTGATIYSIEICSSSDFHPGDIIRKEGKRTQTFTGLLMGIKYYARVSTNVNPNFGPVTTFTTGPIVIAPMNESNGNKTILTVTSSKVTGATLYTFQLSTSPGFTNAISNGAGSYSQKFSGLEYNTTYYARAFVDVGNGGNGAATSFTTIKASDISYVVMPKQGAIDQRTVLNIAANLVPSATEYTIQISESPNFTTIDFEKTGPTRTLAFAGLKYNTTYYSRVRTNLSALNACAQSCEAAYQACLIGAGGDPEITAVCDAQKATCVAACPPGGEEWGATRSFTTIKASDISYVVMPKQGAIDQRTVLNVTANLVPNATEYAIQLSESPDFTTIDFEKTGPTRTLAFTGLKYNTTYYSRVRTNLSASNTCAQTCESTFDPISCGGDPACEAEIVAFRAACLATCSPSGEGWGATRSFTTINASAISYVITPKNGAVGQKVNLNITANLVPNATEYTIQLSESPAFSTIEFEMTGATRTLAFTGLKYNTPYFSRVRTNLSASTNTCAQACEATYQTCVAGAGGDQEILLACASEKATCLSACPPGGEEWGATRSFTTLTAPLLAREPAPAGRIGTSSSVQTIDASQEETAKDFSISVAPNPFRDKLSFIIHTNNLQKAQVGLLDLKGRVIHNSLQETNATIEIGEEMASGTYLLKVQTSQGFKVIRVLKLE
jgi:hypothetical protein